MTKQQPHNKQHSKLGRGLASLLGKNTPEEASSQKMAEITLGNLSVSSFQPRKTFSKEKLSDLAASIRKNGVIQPILVRPNPSKAGRYEIIAGERRFRAAKIAGLKAVPAHILDLDDKEARVAALVENLQRADLNAVEEAQGLQAALTSHINQEELAILIGKSRSHVANTLRLLKLPKPVLDKLASNDISAGHARALLALDDPMAGLKAILSGSLNVRETEALSQKKKASKAKQAALPPEASKIADSFGKRVQHYGLKVKMDARSQGKGSIKISWNNAQQLRELTALLEGK